MLVRILIDNPGHSFTRNIDAKFTSTVKDLLRQGRDMGVQQFLRETLEFMETQRAWDEDLAPLVQMWQKEKGRYNKASSAMVRIGDANHNSVRCQLTILCYAELPVFHTSAISTAGPELLWWRSSCY